MTRLPVSRYLLPVTVALLCAPAIAGAQRSTRQLVWRDELLAADAAVADSTRNAGLARALGRAGASDLVLLYPGAPVIAGRDAALRVITAQQALPRVLTWVPLHAEVSSDGSMGVSYGVTTIIADRTSPESARMGKYLTVWRRDPDGWRMVAHSQLGLVPPSAYTPPANFTPPQPRLPGSAADFVRTDTEFAAHAARAGAPDAFAKYIAADGVLFPATGELVRGKAEARRLIAEGPQSSWVWRPVAAGAAGSRDLGWTVGEAVITPPGGSPFFTKYLTMWRRESDGSIRFIADGGNARPPA